MRSKSRTVCLRAMACIALAVAAAMAPTAGAEQAGSKLRSFQAGMLDAGARHTCAIPASASLVCWGRDNDGQLGDGGATTGSPTPSPVSLPLGRTAVAIAGGDAHTCALLDNGDAACWGRDNEGQLGNGTPGGSSTSPTAVDLPAGRTAIAITTGNLHTCAILDDASVACWGNDADGQLGDGTVATPLNSPIPTAVSLPPGRTAVAIGAGRSHTCAVLDDASAACWGRDVNGQLGDGTVATPPSSPTPTIVGLPSGRTAAAVAAGDLHTCAILDNASISCWGNDINGQLGDGTVATPLNSATPSIVGLPLGRTAVAAGVGAFQTCAILDNGGAVCWGYDGEGQLGDGILAAPADSPIPGTVNFPPGRTAVAITGGGSHTCAVLDDGSAACWGDDANGQLGDGTVASPPTSPVPSTSLVAGSVVARVADLSLEVVGLPSTMTLGVSAQATVRVTNKGPDPATGVRVGLGSSVVQVAGAISSQGTVTGSAWDIGTLAPGAQAALVVTLGAPTSGQASFSAEVVASEVIDPDSKPNDHVTTQDDQAQTALTVLAPAAPPPPSAALPLRLTKFSLARTAFRAKGLAGTRKVGTTIRFTLTTKATVTVIIERKVGRRFTKRGTFRFTAPAGQVRRAFTGRLGTQPLAIGSYRMRLRATAGGAAVSAGPLPFRIATR